MRGRWPRSVVLVRTARVSSAVGAFVWLVGQPIAAQAGIISSDPAYFWTGVVGALLGLFVAPVVIVCAGQAQPFLKPLVGSLGLAACGALVFSGVLLAAAASGELGQRAPGWISPAASLSQDGFFLWVLLASYSMRRARTVGRSAFWLGMLAGATFLVLAALGVLVFYLAPGFMVTDATILPVTLFYFCIWLGLPAWLVALAVGLRPAQTSTISPGGFTS